MLLLVDQTGGACHTGKNSCFDEGGAPRAWTRGSVVTARPSRRPVLDWGDTWPTLEGFVALGETHRVVPVARRLLGDGWTPVAVYAALAASRPGTFILESAQPDGSRSRYSFVGVRSQAALTIVGDTARWTGDVPAGLEDGAPLETIKQALEVLASEQIPGLPPLTGGLVGALGWDIVRQWEPTLPAEAVRELDLPDAHPAARDRPGDP